MINFRKYLISILLSNTGNTLQHLKKMQQWQYSDTNTITKMQSEKLEKLLLHCFNNIPYYTRVLSNASVIKNNKIDMDNFQNIPFLTKEIIREEKINLHCKTNISHQYKNTSGGSTGQPVEFIQDNNYDGWNIACKLLFNQMAGKDYGEKEIKLWGSSRDIIAGKEKLKDRIINYVYNRKLFNCYNFGQNNIKEFIKLNNKFKPKIYWAYLDAAIELAKYLKENKTAFHPPQSVITTIGPLTEQARNLIQENLKCKVYNQYGSREVGALGCECTEQDGLHTFPWANFIECIDTDGNRSNKGEIVVTTLENYSMPLLRYKLGDVIEMGDCNCNCKRNTPKIKKINGRTLGYFIKDDNSLVHSHFIVETLFYHNWIEQFQVIQKKINEIQIKIVTKSIPPETILNEIKAKSKILMGNNCNIIFSFETEIEKSPSGKHIYTVCEIR